MKIAKWIIINRTTNHLIVNLSQTRRASIFFWNGFCFIRWLSTRTRRGRVTFVNWFCGLRSRRTTWTWSTWCAAHTTCFFSFRLLKQKVLSNDKSYIDSGYLHTSSIIDAAFSETVLVFIELPLLADDAFSATGLR